VLTLLLLFDQDRTPQIGNRDYVSHYRSFIMKTQILGFFTPWIAYGVITLLHCFLPGTWIRGYVKNNKTGEPLNYRLNGIVVLAVSIGLWLLLGKLNIVPLDWLYQVRWTSLAGAVVLGLWFSLGIVLPYPSTGKPLPADLWFGRLENPQYRNGRIDAKMWLYLIGAVMLQLNALSFAVHHYRTYGDFNPGVILGVAMLTWFVWDYLSFERVHLYSFYPYFYNIAIWAVVDLPNPRRPLWATLCVAVLFLCTMSRCCLPARWTTPGYVKPNTASYGTLTPKR
jgi:delta14-sterol reductase